MICVLPFIPDYYQGNEQVSLKAPHSIILLQSVLKNVSIELRNDFFFFFLICGCRLQYKLLAMWMRVKFLTLFKPVGMNHFGIAKFSRWMGVYSYNHHILKTSTTLMKKLNSFAVSLH